MNKTLLLILCDFLLLTILSMWKMEDDVPVDDAATSADEQSVGAASLAMMEQDLLDTLKFSLEEEQAQRSELEEDLDAKAQALEAREAELSQRQARIQDLESNLDQAAQRESDLQSQREELESQRQALSDQVAETQSTLKEVDARLSLTEEEARQNAAQSRLLQAELEKKLAEIKEKEAQLAARNEQLDAAQRKAQELDVQVRMQQQENSFLQESVSDLKEAVVAERTQREQLQEQAGVLAQGVSELAASSQDLRQELRSNFEINANQLFSNFNANQVRVTFSAVKLSRNRFSTTESEASTVIVSDGQKYFALAHLDSMPFGLRTNPSTVRSLTMNLQRKGESVRVTELPFLALDPRIVAVPLSEAEARRLGGKPYLTALEPFKFPEAVLVNRQGDYYGEVEFKLDAETPGFVKMQSKIFSSIFGEFSPSTGDLVLSKTGELLGVMVNRRYCALVNNFVPLTSLDLTQLLNGGELEESLTVMNGLLSSFPDPLK